MIKQDFHISNIIARHLSGEITPEENAQLEKWRKADSAHEALFQKICSKENLKKHVESGTSFNTATGWMEVQKRIRKSNNWERMIKILSYAAAVLVPVFFVGISLKYTTHDYFSNKSVLIAQPILPGAAKAILTLDNGETINLNKETADALQTIEGTNIQIDSTTLNYQLAQSTSVSPKPVYNKVEIPRGGEYALVLSDGTKVHLNSMSSLRFPVAFTTGKREVELQGEAYFDVQTDKEHPFYVNTPSGIRVYVYGTRFNVSAYESEDYVETVLESGHVSVFMPVYGTSETLNPGERLLFDKKALQFMKSKVDVSEKTAWKDGKLIFRNTSLDEMLKRLSRHFNVDIHFNNKSGKNYTFRATFRNESLFQILDYLSKSAMIKWKTEEESVLQSDGTFVRKKIIVDLY